MRFFLGFTDELVKLSSLEDKAIEFMKKNPELAKGVARSAGEGAAHGAVGKAIEDIAPTAAGAGIGGLAGKAFLRRGALGALIGLGVVHRKKLLAAAKKAKEKAEDTIQRRVT